jgi:hypothetical protein
MKPIKNGQLTINNRNLSNETLELYVSEDAVPYPQMAVLAGKSGDSIFSWGTRFSKPQ